MKLQQKITLLQELGEYMGSSHPAWLRVKEDASRANGWFLPQFVDLAIANIRDQMLDKEKLSLWVDAYQVPEWRANPKTVGLVMAGNIPLVGFHDFLCIFISGHAQIIKTSSKDEILIKHITDWLYAQSPELQNLIRIQPMLKNCNAYIATGSDNSARYFEQYFARFPHIIRRNRTSVAILDGSESDTELSLLADDIQLYFGLGCRNVTQVWVPEGYDFLPLLNALRKYAYFTDHAKYRHNFDYYLTIQIMNNRYYMTNDSLLLSEDPSPFSPIGQVNYQFYKEGDNLSVSLDQEKIQCVVGQGHTPFGEAQRPGLSSYADGVDTMAFLQYL